MMGRERRLSARMVGLCNCQRAGRLAVCLSNNGFDIHYKPQSLGAQSVHCIDTAVSCPRAFAGWVDPSFLPIQVRRLEV